MSTITRTWIIAGILVLAVLILFAGTWWIGRYFFAGVWRGPVGMMGWQGTGNSPYANRTFTSNGEQIYFTGASQSGPAISYQMQNGYRMPMMNGRLACVDCHGENGQGGTIQMMMMGTVEVPNIQYDNLTASGQYAGETDHPPFTDETIKRAIVDGIDSDGQPLKWPMPRWKMTDGQLSDLIAFLKTLR